MGIYQKVITGLAIFVVAAISTAANAAGLDMSGITGAVDAATVVAAISSIAVIKFGPSFAKWGYAKVTSMFGR